MGFVESVCGVRQFHGTDQRSFFHAFLIVRVLCRKKFGWTSLSAVNILSTGGTPVMDGVPRSFGITSTLDTHRFCNSSDNRPGHLEPYSSTVAFVCFCAPLEYHRTKKVWFNRPFHSKCPFPCRPINPLVFATLSPNAFERGFGAHAARVKGTEMTTVRKKRRKAPIVTPRSRTHLIR